MFHCRVDPSSDRVIKTYHPLLKREVKRATILLIISLALAVVSASLLLFLYGDDAVEKSPLTKQMVSAIKNGGDLDTIKHIYERRKKTIRPIIKKNSGEYYPYDVPFSLVLNDILGDYYSSDPFSLDSLFQSRLSSMIQENEYRNPFDNLEDSQRVYFENVRVICGDKYVSFSDDMNMIASELSTKNQLVTKYLKRSNMSFAISIIALVFTIVLSVWQILLGYKGLKERGQGGYINEK